MALSPWVNRALANTLPAKDLTGHTFTWDAVREQARVDLANQTQADEWVAAGAGSETPFLRDGRWTLYVWNPARSQHGYYDFATDLVDVDDPSLPPSWQA